MAAKKKAAAKTIRIWARRQEAVECLANKEWCDFASTDLASACQDANLVIICAPVKRIIELSTQIAPLLHGFPIVTDVGSAKQDIVAECTRIFEKSAHFIGSHPMAGSEKTGMENAEADLFEDRTCFVTPTEKTTELLVNTVNDFWAALGSSVIQETPQRHDELTAKASHSPHLIAAALASYLNAECPDAGKFCGNGLRDTTRIASGDPALWTEIIFQNKNEILKSLAGFQSELQKFSEAIANDDQNATNALLSQGKEFRDSLV